MVCPEHNYRHFQEFGETCPHCDYARFIDRVLRVVGTIVIGIAIASLITGCAHDNGIIYKPAPKPAPADTINAVGNVLGGAWDRMKGAK